MSWSSSSASSPEGGVVALESITSSTMTSLVRSESGVESRSTTDDGSGFVLSPNAEISTVLSAAPASIGVATVNTTGTTTDVPASMPPLNTSAGFSGSVASHT